VPREPNDSGDFWREVTEPHYREVTQILARAHQAIDVANQALSQDIDATGLERIQRFRDIYNMMRYARRLSPENLDVLRLLGQSADEIGKTREALEALHAAVDVAGPEKAGTEVTGRLGTIYLRLGRLDDAVRYLRLAQSPTLTGPASAVVLVHLATALALRGQTTESIDLLASALPPAAAYYTNEATLISFALAVQLDRDEQRGAAFEVLDRMLIALPGQFAGQVQVSLTQMRFAPAEDEHYYRGLLYEAAGNYVEARAEWALYAAAGNLPYRKRAEDHVAALDRLGRASPASSQNRRPRPPPQAQGVP
jgi:tetratricopeptide (TPR) repeat protein